MESIIQIQNVTKNEFFSRIEDILEDKLDSFIKERTAVNVTVQETSKLLNVTELTVHNYIKKGLLPASKIGRRIVIKRSDVDNALKEVKSLRFKRI